MSVISSIENDVCSVLQCFKITSIPLSKRGWKRHSIEKYIVESLVSLLFAFPTCVIAWWCSSRWLRQWYQRFVRKKSKRRTLISLSKSDIAAQHSFHETWNLDWHELKFWLCKTLSFHFMGRNRVWARACTWIYRGCYTDSEDLILLHGMLHKYELPWSTQLTYEPKALEVLKNDSNSILMIFGFQLAEILCCIKTVNLRCLRPKMNQL